MSKEDRAGKENFPPAPPIREKGETEETSLSLSVARAHEEPIDFRYGIPDLQRRYINHIPSLKMAQHWAMTFYPNVKAEIVAKWYRKTAMSFWADESKQPIHNWGRNLWLYLEYYEKNRRMADPDRIPDARKAGPRHADNWRGTRKEDIGDVLG